MLTVEERVARLETIEELNRLQAHYAKALDDGFDADRLVGLFTEDGAFDATGNGGQRTVGRDALKRMWTGADGSFAFAFHYIVAPDLTVSDDLTVAHGSWYLLEVAQLRRDDHEEGEWQGCSYEVDYIKVGGRWLFQEMRIIGRFRARNPQGFEPFPPKKL